MKVSIYAQVDASLFSQYSKLLKCMIVKYIQSIFYKIYPNYSQSY